MSIDRPLVSVVVPVYNAEKYLAETIDSVISQTYTDWEMILVDDGSTDSSAALAEGYARRDPRIRLIRQPNRGQAIARNRAMEEARGELVAFLDADDIWFPERLEVTVAEFLRGGQDLLCTAYYLFTDPGQLRDRSLLVPVDVGGHTFKGADGIGVFLHRNYATTPSVLARLRVIRAAGGFPDMGMAEDYKLWLTLLYEGYTIRSLPERLAAVRLHPESTSSADRIGARNVLAVIRELEGRYPGAVGRGAYQSAVRKRLRYFVRSVMDVRKPEDAAYLREQLDYWGICTPAVRRLAAMRHAMPPGVFRLLMRSALK